MREFNVSCSISAGPRCCEFINSVELSAYGRENRYEHVVIIGRGSFGNVSKVWDRVDRIYYAMKESRASFRFITLTKHSYV